MTVMNHSTLFFELGNIEGIYSLHKHNSFDSLLFPLGAKNWIQFMGKPKLQAASSFSPFVTNPTNLQIFFFFFPEVSLLSYVFNSVPSQTSLSFSGTFLPPSRSGKPHVLLHSNGNIFYLVVVGDDVWKRVWKDLEFWMLRGRIGTVGNQLSPTR